MAREITYNNFEISLVVFMPNTTTNHAITNTNPRAPKLNIANFATQDYSHILHVYFVGVFCCSHPYKNVILSQSLRIKLVPQLHLVILSDEVCVIRRNRQKLGEIRKVKKILLLLRAAHQCSLKKNYKNIETFSSSTIAYKDQ